MQKIDAGARARWLAGASLANLASLTLCGGSALAQTAPDPGLPPSVTVAEVQAAETKALNTKLQPVRVISRAADLVPVLSVRGIYGVGSELLADIEVSLGPDTVRLTRLHAGDAAGPCRLSAIEGQCLLLTPKVGSGSTSPTSPKGETNRTGEAVCKRICWATPAARTNTTADGAQPGLPIGVPAGIPGLSGPPLSPQAPLPPGMLNAQQASWASLPKPATPLAGTGATPSPR